MCFVNVEADPRCNIQKANRENMQCNTKPGGHQIGTYKNIEETETSGKYLFY